MQDNKKNLSNQVDRKLKIVKNKFKETSISTVFHQTEDYLRDKYNLRFNSIALEIEITAIGKINWKVCNENSLWVEIRKKGINISQSALKALLKSDFVPEFNPFKDYFEDLPEWDKSIDYIRQYASYVKLSPGEDSEQFYYHFTKWCVRTVKCALKERYFNKQAFVLTDDGKGQNIGKSTWCRNLCPPKLSRYIAEDIGHNDKDTRILLCKNFLINLDELAVLSKKEINQLKSLFSKDQINERLPYDSKNTIIPRVASFIGSTNKSTFLQDETGSVRWLCFVIENIDWNYKYEFNVDMLWSQAYALSKDPKFNAELTREDIIQNEKRNNKFQILSAEFELLEEHFEPSDQINGEFMTATSIVAYINTYSAIKVNHIQMGKALTAKNYQRVKKDGKYGYYVKTKKDFSYS